MLACYTPSTMNADLGLLAWLVALIWFLVYWILGGVFFAVMAVLRLGAVRKVRFSCLFSILALGCASGAAWGGLTMADAAVTECLIAAETKAEAITAIFGCGFVGIFSAFFVGLIVLIGIGSLLLVLSTAKTRPWIVLEEKNQDDG